MAIDETVTDGDGVPELDKEEEPDEVAVIEELIVPLPELVIVPDIVPDEVIVPELDRELVPLVVAVIDDELVREPLVE